MVTGAQFLLACLFGSAAFLAVDSPNGVEKLLAGLIAGIGGQWAAVFAYVWLRYGWRAARSMRMDMR